MNDQDNDRWGERLAAEGAAAGTDQPSLRRLLGDAVGVVKGRLGEVSRTGIRPLLDEAAAQVRPATLTELRTRYPGLSEDEVARRLIDRAARTAAGLALLVGGMIAAQGAVAVASAAAPPATGAAIGSIGVTALAEVLALFLLEAKLRADLGALAGQPSLSSRELAANVLGDVQAAGGWKEVRSRSLRLAEVLALFLLEAKLRADLGALAGQPSLSSRELAANVLGDVQAAGGWKEVRSRSLRLALPDAAMRRAAVRLAAMVPARFARIVLPEIIAPLIGSAVAAKLASRQVRAGGEQHWGRLRTMPRTTAEWGAPITPNGGRPPSGWHPSGWGPPPGDGPRQLPPPPDR